MPTYEVTDSRTGVVITLTGNRPPTEKELEDIFAQYSPSAQPKAGKDPSLGRIATGLAAEVAIGTAGQAAGIAAAPFTLGISYPVLAFSSGVTGSIAAQKIEGKDEISLGRALFAGAINLIPGSAAAKAGTKTSTILGKEAMRGTMIGAGEATSMAVIDEGRLPTAQEVFTYGALGGASAPVIGLAMKGISRMSSRGRELLDSFRGKTNDEIKQQLDVIATNGTPEQKAAATEIVDNVGEQLGLVRADPTKSAQESAAVMGVSPTKPAAESAEVLKRGIERSEELQRQFTQGKTEQELKEALVENRLAGPEQVAFDPETPFEQIQLSVLDTRRGQSARERARLEKALGRKPEEPLPTTEDVLQDVQNIPGVGGRAGARRMGLEGGFITPGTALTVARTGTGAVIGASQGETPEERLQYAAMGAALGAASTPKLFKTVFQGGDKLWKKVKGKTPKQIDEMIKSGEIAPREFGPSSDDPAIVSAATPIKREAERIQLKTVEEPTFELAVAKPSELINPKAEGLRRIGASLAPSRFIGSDANEAIIAFKNSVAGMEELGSRLRVNIQKTIADEPNPPEAQKAVNAYIGGETDFLPNSLKSLKADLDLGREKILDLQKQLLSNIDAGITRDPTGAMGGTVLPTGERINSIIQRSIDRGNYLTREYRFFWDKEYFPSAQQRKEATQELADSFYLEAGQSAQPITRERAFVLANEYLNELDSKKLSEVGSYNVFPSSIDGFLKGRKEIGPAVRSYLGEITDPGERLAGTMSRLARGVYRDVADSEIIRTFSKLGIGSPTRTDPRMVPLVLRKKGVDGPQLYVAPHVQDSINQLYLNGADEQVGNLFLRSVKDLYQSGVSLSKAVKVLGNPPSYSVQVYGNATTLLAQGINPFGNGFTRGLRIALSEFGPIERLGKNPEARKALLNDIQDATKYGIKGSNIVDSDIRSGLEGGVFGKTLQKGLDPFSKAYSVMDTVGRYVSWKQNQKVLDEFFPSANAETLKNFAAQITNNTYPNYQRLASSLRAGSRFGLIPQFASFTLEFLRNQYHQGVVITQMLSGTLGSRVPGLGPANVQRMQIEGAKRLAALVSVYAGTAAAVKVFNQDSGVDQSTENALRDVAIPDYDQSRMLAMTFDKKTMTGKYANPSYIVPHAAALSALEAGLNGSPASSVGDLLKQEFLGEGTLFGRSLYSALLGYDPVNGKPITYQTDPFERAKESIEFFIDDAFSPGLVREITKLGQARRGQGELTVEDVVARQFGARLNPINVNLSARFKFKALSDRAKLATADYTASRDYRKLSPEAIEAQYQKSNLAKRDAMAVAIRHISSLRVLGMDDNKIIEVMQEGGLGSKDILAAFDGEVLDIPRIKRVTPSDYWSENLSMLPQAEQRKEIIKMSRSRETAGLAKDLMRTYEQEMRYKARGISPQDRLILSLGIGDGERAEYLHRKAMEAPDYNAYLQNAIRRNLATKEVVMQMNTIRQSQNRPRY